MYVYIYIYIYTYVCTYAEFFFLDKHWPEVASSFTPNPPTNIVPTNIARLKLSGNFPMNLGIPPL